MKRKRGHKKGKPKVNPVVNTTDTPVNAENNDKEEDSVSDEPINDKYESGMEVDTPSSTGTDQPSSVANINPDGSIHKAEGKAVGRVKVKIRASKMMESQPTSSDAPTQSDTDKSSQQQGIEKQGLTTERTEDSANSLPEMKTNFSSNKAGSITIKSSNLFGSCNNQTGNARSGLVENTYHRKAKLSQEDPRYTKEELDAALMVVNKIMKMDAAEPFNVPVNPEVLGIPDYFDVIDTPMDFGTICSNLERGRKYMNSEDVFSDVQCIWDNCYKYNNKGDYILDLMRRVKKNFMKYWAAAGLYCGQSREAKGVEGTQAEDVGPSSDGKVVKGGQSKHKARKRGGRRHKFDCLCAICVLKRRRKEREENDRIARGNGSNLAEDFKQEESMLVESPCGEDSSSNMDDSLGPDADAEDDEKGELKLEDPKKDYSSLEEKHDDGDDNGDEDDEDDDNDNDEDDNEEEVEESKLSVQMKDDTRIVEHSQFNGILEEQCRGHEPGNTEKLSSGVGIVTQEEEKIEQHGEEPAVQQELKKSHDKFQKANLLENLSFHNPMLLHMCGSLFPDSIMSVWSGPHSLNQHRSTPRMSSIHAALDSFMK